ncbi:MAG TPA: bifunctional oligoribonuclease/PAP phosphatase NrnA [Candidatus Manganitrophaceae bacterium]|nr:bifunctional oligoribonuclease/PAP phosphatase NrnA [Candidatus Manganitrophaceae bacterium]
MSLEQAAAVLQEKETFLIAGHVNPEGDAVGSGLALALALRKIGKEAEVVNRDPLPKQLGFLPHEGVYFQRASIDKPVDALVVVDCADLRRTGFYGGEAPPVQTLINIDHHVTNPGFGAVNWIDPRAEATGVMIYDLLNAMRIRIDPPIAASLYTALLSETGSFRYRNTTPKSLRIGAELIERGADPVLIARALFETHSIGRARLLGEVLTKFESSEDQKIVWALVTQEEFRRTGATEEDTEDFVNTLRSIEGIEAALLFRETGPDNYKISFRSQGRVDVAGLAIRWGGGGHRNAAGCSFIGKWDKMKREVLTAVGEAVLSGLPA